MAVQQELEFAGGSAVVRRIDSRGFGCVSGVQKARGFGDVATKPLHDVGGQRRYAGNPSVRPPEGIPDETAVVEFPHGPPYPGIVPRGKRDP